MPIISRDELKMTNSDKESFATFEHMEVRLQTGVELVYICILYRLQTTFVSTFLDNLTSFLDCHTTTAGHLLLVGKFNLID